MHRCACPFSAGKGHARKVLLLRMKPRTSHPVNSVALYDFAKECFGVYLKYFRISNFVLCTFLAACTVQYMAGVMLHPFVTVGWKNSY